MADKNSVTVLKDGQLAVATVAQNGEIISEPSAISTTVLVQTAEGAQLAVPTVDLNGGGGGGGYVLPAATAETLGGIKVGEGLSVTEDGTLSAQGGGDVPEGVYTRTNLIGGNGIQIEEYVPPYIIDENTLALWHFEDSDINAITQVTGELQNISTYFEGKFGKATGLNNGTVGYGAFEIASDEDFTYDFWYKLDYNDAFFYCSDGYRSGIGIVRKSSTQVSVYYDFTEKGVATVEDASAWNHYAIQRKSGSYDVYVNGKKVSLSQPITDTWSKGSIYGWGRSSGCACDELRISNVARYDGNFTPLNRPYSQPDPQEEPVYQINQNNKMTWLTGNVGNTLDISSITGKVYQVFRNGLLLQNGFVQKQHKFLSASSGQYFTITPKLNTSTASKWAFQFMYQTPGSLNRDMRFISNAISDYNTPVLALTYDDFALYLGNSGSSWDIANAVSSGDAAKENTTYNIDFGFSGTEYYVNRAQIGKDMERVLTLPSTQKQYFDASNSVLSFLNTGWNTGYYNNGKFALDTLIITQDDTIIFNGETAVEGTDWTNHNCTITTENYNYPSLAYTQSGDVLTFSEPLLATDRICVVSM